MIVWASGFAWDTQLFTKEEPILLKTAKGLASKEGEWLRLHLQVFFEGYG